MKIFLTIMLLLAVSHKVSAEDEYVVTNCEGKKEIPYQASYSAIELEMAKIGKRFVLANPGLFGGADPSSPLLGGTAEDLQPLLAEILNYEQNPTEYQTTEDGSIRLRRTLAPTATLVNGPGRCREGYNCYALAYKLIYDHVYVAGDGYYDGWYSCNVFSHEGDVYREMVKLGIQFDRANELKKMAEQCILKNQNCPQKKNEQQYTAYIYQASLDLDVERESRTNMALSSAGPGLANDKSSAKSEYRDTVKPAIDLYRARIGGN
jgi:hypothetical protein